MDNVVFNHQWHSYVNETASSRGIDFADEDAMEDLRDELAWEWLDIEAERDAGKAVLIEVENCSEVIIIEDPTTKARELEEKYLSEKWGLELPDDHPYSPNLYGVVVLIEEEFECENM